ncbi:receptor-interacting serine/threonine-protein kinase 1 [Protobothrops mucrosquamatus]|uniref:receptor-interacting serine/threonine-protein kinase 1 n=1 Tax=Protobothrops mucrosquamatus TaxID=103944 RepID=UPI000775BAA3|nr:receptor-interacting serine/threonine-protein kinase 1 [Protobothrops mucrosquamatus]
MALADIQMKSEDFLEKNQLNAGGFGTVSLCYHKNYGLVVLKTVYTGPKRTECNTSLLEEGMIMHKLNHDRVVKLLGVILEDGNYSLVIEYIRKGDLMSVLKATPIFLPVKGRFVLETIEGMLYLTEQGLVHKDLKPENILVDENFHIKIADLGVACFKNWSRLTKEETSRQRKIKQNSKSNAGTLSYMAPEHLQDINAMPVEKSDVYSFGIVLWAIFAAKEPYENAVTDTQLCYCITAGNRPPIREVEDSCPNEIITLMERSWQQQPNDRPTFAEINLIYKPYYYKNFEEEVEDHVRKLKEIYPEPIELVKRMESLQVDAMSEPPSRARSDQPGSLHSSQGFTANTIDENMFAPYPENEPVESCENALEPPATLQRKLQDELNYHLYGSRMDRPENPSAAFSAEIQEEESRRRRRKVSYDPFAKAAATPQTPELHPRAQNIEASVSHNNIVTAHSSHPWHSTPSGARDPNGFLGAGAPLPRRVLSAEDLYGAPSAANFNFNKPPVPESGVHSQAKPFSPYHYSQSLSTETGPVESTPFRKFNFAHPMGGIPTEEPPHYNIYNSTGIQIGSYNYLEIKNQDIRGNSPPATTDYSAEEHQKIFDSTAIVSDIHLNLVRDNLSRQWKHCARKLGFNDPELDEIDHDYERDGLKEKVYQMFQRWLMKEGSKGATVGKLARALFACKRIDLVNSFIKISQDSERNNR